MSSADVPAAYQQDEFRVGNVLGRSLGVLSRHVLAFVLVTAAAKLPAFLLGLFASQMHLQPRSAGFWQLAGAVGLVQLLLVPVTQAIVFYAAFQDMRGQPLRLGESIVRGLRRFFPFIGTWFCMGMLMMIGFVALVVPGVIAVLATAVAIPVCVVERLGPFASIGRSRYLTKGSRWKILGIFMVLFVVGIAIVVLQRVVTLTLGAGTTATLGAGTTAVFAFVTQSVIGAFSSILILVVYHDLRVAKEGLDTERIAAVFD